MSKKQRGQFAACTIQFDHRVSVLEGEVGIGQARTLGPDEPTPHAPKFHAVWDTGASKSVITQRVVSTLNLPNIFPQVPVYTANGLRQANVYLVNLYLSDIMRITGIQVMDGEMTGIDALIGMDVIGLGDFAITHSDGRTCMTFRAPSGKRIDYVEQFKAYNGR